MDSDRLQITEKGMRYCEEMARALTDEENEFMRDVIGKAIIGDISEEDRQRFLQLAEKQREHIKTKLRSGWSPE